MIAEPVNGKVLNEPVLTVIGKVVPLPLVNVIVFDNTEAVNNASGTDTAFWANEAVVANDADVAILAVDAFCTLLTVIPNVDALPLVNVISALFIDAVNNASGTDTAF
jgi:hypothetical protein